MPLVCRDKAACCELVFMMVVAVVPAAVLMVVAVTFAVFIILVCADAVGLLLKVNMVKCASGDTGEKEEKARISQVLTTPHNNNNFGQTYHFNDGGC